MPESQFSYLILVWRHTDNREPDKIYMDSKTRAAQAAAEWMIWIARGMRAEIHCERKSK